MSVSLHADRFRALLLLGLILLLPLLLLFLLLLLPLLLLLLHLLHGTPWNRFCYVLHTRRGDSSCRTAEPVRVFLLVHTDDDHKARLSACHSWSPRSVQPSMADA